MEGADYKVSWYASGLDFNYSGTVTVWAYGVKDATERAQNQVSRSMCLSKSLISIGSVN